MAIKVFVVSIGETVVDFAEFEIIADVVLFFCEKTGNDIGGVDIHPIMKIIIIDHEIHCRHFQKCKEEEAVKSDEKIN